MFALEWDDLKPSMVCLGKGIGSGMPASALAGESRIFASMGVGEMSSTCGGNPLASAASHAVLDVMEKEKLPENALKVGEYIMGRLGDLQEKHGCLGDVRGKGLVIGLEFVEDRERKTPASELTSKLLLKAGENGLLLGKVGLHGNVVRIAPPLVVTKEEAGMGIDIIDRTLSELT